MVETKEINALFTLIDDPDEDVFSSVSERIIDFGKGIIPNLEHLWENTLSQSIQERIELLIHKLHFIDLKADFKAWNENPYNDILSGALLMAKFNEPDLDISPILKDIEKIRKNVWLELNNYLTPLEQANVLSSIIFNYMSLKGAEISYKHADEFFINKVLETKRGNALTNGIIYQIIAEQLDINARIINIPKQLIIAFYHKGENPFVEIERPEDQIIFFVDGINGQAYGHQDIENYLKRIGVNSSAKLYKPLTNLQIIQFALREASKCYTNGTNNYRQFELLQLADLLNKTDIS